MGRLSLIAKFVLCALFSAEFTHGKMDATADVMKDLKDSGVLNDIQEKLGEMLREKEAGKQKPFDWNAERLRQCDVSKFVSDYVAERGLDFGQDLMAKLSEVQQDEGVDKVAHFEQLAVVIDGISEKLKEGKIDAEGLLAGNFGEHFASLSLLKTYIGKLEKEQGKEQDKREQSIAGTIRTFTKMAENDPRILLNAVGGALVNFGVVSPEIVQTVSGIAGSMLESEEARSFIVSAGDSLASLAESDGMEELLPMLPLLITEEGRKELLEYVADESEEQLMVFVKKMANPDVRDGLVVQLSESVVYAYKYLFKDDMKLLMGNAFLLAQGFPPLRSSDVIVSSLDVASKGFRLFAGIDFDMAPTKRHAKELVQAFEKEYVRSDEFDRLKDAEQSAVVAKFLVETVIPTVQLLLNANQFSFNENQANCAKTAVCSLNEHFRKESATKRKVTYGISMLLGWIWSASAGMEVGGVYEAAHNGAQSTKPCSELFGGAPNCNFVLEQKGKMRLDFERQEL